jgi:hypothetical protein
MVFQTKELGKGWDGTVNQQPAAAGVYVWVVRARNKISGQIEYKESTVTLIR